jgi:hypothetical protein
MPLVWQMLHAAKAANIHLVGRVAAPCEPHQLYVRMCIPLLLYMHSLERRLLLSALPQCRCSCQRVHPNHHR